MRQFVGMLLAVDGPKTKEDCNKIKNHKRRSHPVGRSNASVADPARSCARVDDKYAIKGDTLPSISRSTAIVCIKCSRNSPILSTIVPRDATSCVSRAAPPLERRSQRETGALPVSRQPSTHCLNPS